MSGKPGNPGANIEALARCCSSGVLKTDFDIYDGVCSFGFWPAGVIGFISFSSATNERSCTPVLFFH